MLSQLEMTFVMCYDKIMKNKSLSELIYGLADIAFLTLLSGAVLFEKGVTIASVAALLVAVTASLVLLYSDGRATFCICLAVVCVYTFFVPETVLLTPMIAYHACGKGHFSWLTVIFIIPFAINYRDGETFIHLLVPVISVLAVYLSVRSRKLMEMRREARLMRDAGVERERNLNDKNRDLMARQDYEVHVATLKERNRIAREIHDNVGHMLTRSILQVGAMMTVYREEPLHGQLESINQTLDTAMNNIRESVHDIYDESIDLKQSVTDAVEPVRGKLEVKIDYDMSESVPRNVKYAFISTVKEAVSNVVKHSDGDMIHIILREHPALYQLCIDDNGSISRLPQGLSDGIGLRNMRARAEEIGGNIRFEADKGFHIFISVPKK